jgi:Dolichyl-phosphate-mannose-protein mannosyltransferase
VEETNLSPAPYLPSRWLAFTFLFLSIVVIVCVRVRLLDFPLERDEGEYAYIGQLILKGIPPYQLAGNMKLPGIYLAYAAIMAIFGQTPAGIHLGLLLVNLATVGALFFVARYFLDLYGTVIAAAAYGLMTLSPAYLGLAAHATHFVVLPALVGIAILFRIKKSGGLASCFAAGLFFGIAFLMKQPGAFFGLWGGLYLIWIAITEKMMWRQTLVRLCVYSTGCVVPFLVICLWLKIAGVFPQFWFWTVTYVREYATIVTFNDALGYANVNLGRIFNSTGLVYIFAGLGLIYLFSSRLILNQRVFLGGFFAFSFLAVCPDLYFRPHYFILLLPAIALLAGVGISFSCRGIAQDFRKPLLYHVLFLFGIVVLTQNLYVNHAVLFSLSPREACRAVYGINPFPESLDIARYIEQNSSKDQRIAIIADEPQIYFYSHRLSSSSQIYPSQVMDPRPYAHKMQERMISEIQQNPPEYLIYTSIYASLLERPNSDPLLLNWVRGYVKQNMRLVGVIQFTSHQTTSDVWGTDAETTSLDSPYYILVYRKSGSINTQPKSIRRQ